MATDMRRTPRLDLLPGRYKYSRRLPTAASRTELLILRRVPASSSLGCAPARCTDTTIAVDRLQAPAMTQRELLGAGAAKQLSLKLLLNDGTLTGRVLASESTPGSLATI